MKGPQYLSFCIGLEGGNKLPLATCNLHEIINVLVLFLDVINITSITIRVDLVMLYFEAKHAAVCQTA